MRTLHQYKPGDIFDKRYKLKKLIGKGGFAEVWLADDKIAGKEIAIKIYAHLDKEGQNLLVKEYNTVSALYHPYILKADDISVCDNRPYLKMKYCAGGNLNTHIGRFSATDMFQIVHDIMSALVFLHENHVVHQDIKPANILIDTTGNKVRYVLCDFGISARTRNSMSMSIKGVKENAQYLTTFYAPPEKFSIRQIDHEPYNEGDLFSFGLTLLELTGVLNGKETSLGQEMMYNGVREVDLNSLPSKELQFMVAKMLDFDRSKRGSASLYLKWVNNVIEKLNAEEKGEVILPETFMANQEIRIRKVAEESGFGSQVSSKVEKVDADGKQEQQNGHSEPAEEDNGVDASTQEEYNAVKGENNLNSYGKSSDYSSEEEEDNLEILEIEEDDNSEARHNDNYQANSNVLQEGNKESRTPADEETLEVLDLIEEDFDDEDRTQAPVVEMADARSYYKSKNNYYPYDSYYNVGSRISPVDPELPLPSQPDLSDKPQKSKAWLIYVLSAILAAVITFSIIYIIDNNRSSTISESPTDYSGQEEEDIYIPSKEVIEIESNYSRLQKDVETFSKTTFTKRSNFNAQRAKIIIDISNQIDALELYKKKSGHKGDKKSKKLADLKNSLLSLMDRMNSYTYLNGSVPIGDS